MVCSPLIGYILICLAFCVPYPRYSLLPLNLVGNIVIGGLLYYLCKILIIMPLYE